MPSTTPLTDAIQALTTYANETTGASDTTLSAAVGTLVAGYGGGSGWTTDGILDGSEPNGNLVANTATKIKAHLFRGRSGITSLTSSSITEVEQSGLEASLISTISLTACTTLGNSAIRNNTSLTSLYLPALTSIGQYSLAGCSNLPSLSLPNCEYLGNSAFENCTSLTSVSVPKLKTLSNGCLRNCRFPMIVLPSATSIDTYSLSNNSSLTTVDIGTSGKTKGGSVFINDTNLTTLILRISTEICPCTNANYFNGTPFASDGTGGTLYVPSALISSYQSATNWSTILGYANNQILPIEGSQYETAYADGTPIE